MSKRDYPAASADEFVRGVADRLTDCGIFFGPIAADSLREYWYEEVAPLMDWA